MLGTAGCSSRTTGAVVSIGMPEQDITAKFFKNKKLPDQEDDFLIDDVVVDEPAAPSEAPPLMRHQLENIEKYKDASFIPIFDAPGTGKSATIIKIAQHKYEKGEINALLIIAPNGVHRQWAHGEIPKWLNIPYELRVVDGRTKAKPFVMKDRLQICCTNVDTFSTQRKWIDITEWANYMNTMVCLDEATGIKSYKAARTQHILYGFNKTKRAGKRVLQSIPLSKARAALTGTPITNSVIDLWSIMEFCKPGFWGLSYWGFQSKYCLTALLSARGGVSAIKINKDMWEQIKNDSPRLLGDMAYSVATDVERHIKNQEKFEGPFRNVSEIKERLHEVGSFHSLEECVDMPEQVYVKRPVVMSTGQRSVYNDMKKKYIAEYEGVIAEAKNKLTVLIRLQQITSGFLSHIEYMQLDDVDSYGSMEDEVIDVPFEKVATWISPNEKLKALLADIEEHQSRFIVCTHFTAEAGMIYDSMKDAGYGVMLYTGWKKTGTIEQFQKGEFQGLIANTRCISRGFNLQDDCHYMHFYSNTFSLEDRIQVEGRIYRTGQKNKCVYYDYTCVDSVDELCLDTLKERKVLLDYVMDSSVSVKSLLEGVRDE
jgi:hypothetical protein